MRVGGSNLHARSRQEAQSAGPKAGVTAKDLQSALTAFNVKPKAGVAQLTQLGVRDGTPLAAVRVALRALALSATSSQSCTQQHLKPGSPALFAQIGTDPTQI